MPHPETPLAAPRATDGASGRRWDEMLRGLACLLPAGPASVLIDGAGEPRTMPAARLAATLNAGGRPCIRLPAPGHDGDADSSGIPAAAIRLADGPGWSGIGSWDVVIWVRTAPARSGHSERRDGEDGADIVIDLHDPDWPVIRRVAARHGRTVSPDEPLAAGPLRRSTQAAGWQLTSYDDAVERFFAVAVRR